MKRPGRSRSTPGSRGKRTASAPPRRSPTDAALRATARRLVGKMLAGVLAASRRPEADLAVYARLALAQVQRDLENFPGLEIERHVLRFFVGLGLVAGRRLRRMTERRRG